MHKIDIIKKLWEDIYDPLQEPITVIRQYFHPEYEQVINGVRMGLAAYVDHVIAQKENMKITNIHYEHVLENGDEVFAIYYPVGITTNGQEIEAEVISYFLFQGTQVITIHGQVRLIKGSYDDADM